MTTIFSRFRGRFSTAAILLAFVAALAASGYGLVNFAVDRLLVNNARIADVFRFKRGPRLVHGDS